MLLHFAIVIESALIIPIVVANIIVNKLLILITCWFKQTGKNRFFQNTTTEQKMNRY